MRIDAEGICLNERAVQGSSLAGYAECRPQHPLESQNFGTDHMARREGNLLMQDVHVHAANRGSSWEEDDSLGLKGHAPT